MKRLSLADGISFVALHLLVTSAYYINYGRILGRNSEMTISSL